MRHVITRQLFQAQNRLFAPLFAPKVRFSVTQNLLYDISAELHNPAKMLNPAILHSLTGILLHRQSLWIV